MLYLSARLLLGIGSIKAVASFINQPQASSPAVFIYRSEMNYSKLVRVKMHQADEYDEDNHVLPYPKKPNRNAVYEQNKKRQHHKAVRNEFGIDQQNQVLLNMNERFTYQASRYEEGWLASSIAEFYQNDWISNIDRMIKGGKEASVYLCQPGHHLQVPWIAAKIYRPRKFRNLRNDKLYREGREDLDENGNVIIDGGMLVAMRKKTSLGKQLLHQSWIKHEFNTMQSLYNAGCDIPQPFISGANGILMAYIGERLIPAPALQAVQLTGTEVRQIAQQVLYNIETMLRHQRIHGDLSPFNILYWQGQIKLIDFPQAIHPNQNPQAYAILCRDIQKMNEYFALYGVCMAREGLAEELWKQFAYKNAADYIYDLPDQLDDFIPRMAADQN